MPLWLLTGIGLAVDYILDGFIQALHLLFSRDSETFSAVRATLLVSSYSMAASLLIGIPLGFLIGYTDFPGKKAIRTVVDTLLAFPTVLIGLLVYIFISRRGPLGEFELLFTLKGIAIGLTVLALPIIVALTATAIESLDQRVQTTLLTLGASRKQLLTGMIVEAKYGVFAAAVTAFGRVLTEVGIAMMVGGNIKWYTRTMTTAIALETNKGEFAMGIALGMVLLLIALAVNISLTSLRKSSRR